MRTHHLPTIPKLNLPPEGREAVRIARQYARTGIYERITEPMHDPGPPAESLQPVESGTPEPQSEPWKPTPEEMERLRRTQAVMDQVIQDRIRQVEASQYSHPIPPCRTANKPVWQYCSKSRPEQP